jgi:hypothetical protein
LDIQTVLAEFGDKDQGWIIVGPGDRELHWPHANYPGTAVVPIFMSKIDADTLIEQIPSDAPAKRQALRAKEVRIREFAAIISQRKDAGENIGFVVHPPNEVFEFSKPREE